MASLRELFADAGAQEVTTYIQSGNVVFSARPEQGAQVVREAEALIEARFGFRAPVVLRRAEVFSEIARQNPFLSSAPDVEQKHLHVAFLSASPSSEQVASLDPKRSPHDTFEVEGAHIYLHCPRGLARTKLTNAYFDKTLGVVSTMRNWKTVLKLIAMVEAL